MIEDKKEHYLYMFFDPRYFGPFKYHDLTFDLKPIYVGISKAKYFHRKNRHLSECYRNKEENKIKGQIFRGIKKDTGQDPIFIAITTNISKKEAQKLEIEYIAKIGRIINDSGPLANITLGGESGHGMVPWNKGKSKNDNESLKIISEKIKLWNESPDRIDRFRGENNPRFGKDLSGINSPTHKYEFHIWNSETKEYFYTTNLFQFCLEREIKTTSLRRVMDGERRYFKQWIGFKRKYNDSYKIDKEELNIHFNSLLKEKDKGKCLKGQDNPSSKYVYFLYKDGFFLYEGYSLNEMSILFGLKKSGLVKVSINGNKYKGYQVFREAYK